MASASDSPVAPGALGYLRTGVKIEPLVCRWHAWQHLVAPAQLAMNLAYRFLPLLESFAANPTVHASACSDPMLYGGSFVELPTSEVPNVRALIADTRRRGADLLLLADAIRTLDGQLRGVYAGHSLDAAYAAAPTALQGVAEMSYDLAHQPLFRLREALLYRQFEASAGLQEVLLHLTPDADRQFFLNTPRLNLPAGSLSLPLPFADPRLDDLSRARTEPADVEALAASLEIPEADLDAFRALFTEAPPRRLTPNYDGPDVRVRYFGHACVLLETAEVAILLDPSFAFERPDEATLTIADLPDRIDYVFLSHSHQDHLVLESLIQLRNRIGTVVIAPNAPGSLADPSVKLTLQSIGLHDVVTLDELEQLSVPGGEILSLPFPGEHCGLDVRSRHCAAITLKGRRFLFLVDSDAVDPELYRRLSAYVRDVDLLFIGMECHGAPLTWLYGPILLRPIGRNDDNSRRGSGSNCERAWRVVEAIGCKRLFIYAMGMEPWNRHLLGLAYTDDSIQIVESNALLARCEAAGIPAERLKGTREIILPAAAPVSAALMRAAEPA